MHQQTVGQGTLPVVNVGDDAKVTDVIHVLPAEISEHKDRQTLGY
jgi:hypothetical protein